VEPWNAVDTRVVRVRKIIRSNRATYRDQRHWSGQRRVRLFQFDLYDRRSHVHYCDS
jgi:hypothetical protein